MRTTIFYFTGTGNSLQIARDICRGLPNAEIQTLDSDTSGQWVKVHRSGRSTDGPSNLAKRGYWFRITFSKPVSGPIALGHSSHFGLGLFVPVPDTLAR